jgi:hypothetical protein
MKSRYAKISDIGFQQNMFTKPPLKYTFMALCKVGCIINEYSPDNGNFLTKM